MRSFAATVRREFLTALLVIALAGGGGSLAAARQAGDLTVQRVLSYAFPTGLTAAPDGSAIAWVLDERGARNVWLATAPEFEGRRLTSYATDDGQTIGNLQFTADSSTLT